MDNEQRKQINTYGLPRDLFAAFKLYGIRAVTIGFVLGSTLGAIQLTGNGRVFPYDQMAQYLLFIFLTFIMTTYLMLPFNGGKNNLGAFIIFFSRRLKRYQSIDKRK